MLAGQAQKEFYVNEAHALADALLHAACEDEAAAPPVDPADGEAWLVATGATERHQVQDFPYRPSKVVDSIADVLPFVSEGVLPEDV